VLLVLTSEILKDLVKSEKRMKKRKNNKLRPRRNPRVEREKDLLLHQEKNNDVLTIYCYAFCIFILDF
jgi:IS5 family transposase